MNFTQLNKFDTVNGPGIRVSLFVSGCTKNCKGCFNQEAKDFNAGKLFTGQTLHEILQALRDPAIDGISILGGDPLEEANIETVDYICKTVKANYPDKTVWVWTGALHHQINPNYLTAVDVLVDGPFVESKKVEGQFFGSSNQRIIKLKEL